MVTSANIHDDPPNTTKGGVAAGPGMPILAPATAGQTQPLPPYLDHPSSVGQDTALDSGSFANNGPSS
jgi:hypothetical protein